jgi:hypothetical protein
MAAAEAMTTAATTVAVQTSPPTDRPKNMAEVLWARWLPPVLVLGWSVGSGATRTRTAKASTKECRGPTYLDLLAELLIIRIMTLPTPTLPMKRSSRRTITNGETAFSRVLHLQVPLAWPLDSSANASSKKSITAKCLAILDGTLPAEPMCPEPMRRAWKKATLVLLLATTDTEEPIASMKKCHPFHPLAP